MIGRHLIALAAVSCILAATFTVYADCVNPGHVWELELERVERLDGPGDTQVERMTIGDTATLSGSLIDVENPQKAQAWLENPTQSWTLSFEQAP